MDMTWFLVSLYLWFWSIWADASLSWQKTLCLHCCINVQNIQHRIVMLSSLVLDWRYDMETWREGLGVLWPRERDGVLHWPFSPTRAFENHTPSSKSVVNSFPQGCRSPWVSTYWITDISIISNIWPAAIVQVVQLPMGNKDGHGVKWSDWDA